MKKFTLTFLGRKIGFTLTELLVVVIIMAVLATLTLPMFLKTIEKAKVNEALENLNLIRTGEKIYFLEYNTYSPTIVDLNIEDPNNAPDRYFDYSIVSGSVSASDFTARAERTDEAPSPYKDDYYEIKKDGSITDRNSSVVNY